METHLITSISFLHEKLIDNPPHITLPDSISVCRGTINDSSVLEMLIPLYNNLFLSPCLDINIRGKQVS